MCRKIGINLSFISTGVLSPKKKTVKHYNTCTHDNKVTIVDFDFTKRKEFLPSLSCAILL